MMMSVVEMPSVRLVSANFPTDLTHPYTSLALPLASAYLQEKQSEFGRGKLLGNTNN